MTPWKWLSIAAIVIGQASYGIWAWAHGAGWRAVVVGIGLAIVNVAIFTQPTDG